MGETMAVMLGVGGLDRLPLPLWDMTASTHTLTSKIGREAAEALGFGLKWHAIVGLGAILFTLVIGITLVGQIIRPRRSSYA